MKLELKIMSYVIALALSVSFAMLQMTVSIQSFSLFQITATLQYFALLQMPATVKSFGTIQSFALFQSFALLQTTALTQTNSLIHTTTLTPKNALKKPIGSLGTNTIGDRALVLRGSSEPHRVFREINYTYDNSTMHLPANEERPHLYVGLKNGARFLLVRDESEPLATVSLTLQGGSMFDPDNTPGFLFASVITATCASKAYPLPLDLYTFLSRNSGSFTPLVTNTFVSLHVRIRHEAVDELLSRLAALLTNPLFTVSSLLRIRETINSIAKTGFTEYGDAVNFLSARLANPTGPYSKPSFGLLDSKFERSSRPVLEKVVSAMRDHFLKLASADALSLVIFSNQPVYSLHIDVVEHLSTVPNRHFVSSSLFNRVRALPFAQPNYLPALVYVDLDVVKTLLYFTFPTHYFFEESNVPVENYLQDVLLGKFQGSLLSVLGSEGLQLVLGADVFSTFYGNVQTFSIAFYVNAATISNKLIDEVGSHLFLYLAYLENRGLITHVMHSIMLHQRTKFNFGLPWDNRLYEHATTLGLAHANPLNVVSHMYFATPVNEQRLKEFHRQLVPKNCQIVAICNLKQPSETEPITQLKYVEGRVDASSVRKQESFFSMSGADLQAEMLRRKLCEPPPNPFLANYIPEKSWMGRRRGGEEMRVRRLVFENASINAQSKNVSINTLSKNESASGNLLDSVEAYHVTDSRFSLPYCKTCISFFTNFQYESGDNFIVVYFLIEYMNYLLERELQAAFRVGATAKFKLDFDSVELCVLSHESMRSAIFERLAETLLNEKNYDSAAMGFIVKAKVHELLLYSVYQNTVLVFHEAFYALLYDKYISKNDYSSILQRLDVGTMNRHVSSLFNSSHVKAFYIGPAEASLIEEDILTFLKQIGRNKGLGAFNNNWLQMRMIHKFYIRKCDNDKNLGNAQNIGNVQNIDNAHNLGNAKNLGNVQNLDNTHKGPTAAKNGDNDKNVHNKKNLHSDHNRDNDKNVHKTKNLRSSHNRDSCHSGESSENYYYATSNDMIEYGDGFEFNKKLHLAPRVMSYIIQGSTKERFTCEKRFIIGENVAKNYAITYVMKELLDTAWAEFVQKMQASHLSVLVLRDNSLIVLSVSVISLTRRVSLLHDIMSFVDNTLFGADSALLDKSSLDELAKRAYEKHLIFPSKNIGDDLEFLRFQLKFIDQSYSSFDHFHDIISYLTVADMRIFLAQLWQGTHYVYVALSRQEEAHCVENSEGRVRIKLPNGTDKSIYDNFGHEIYVYGSDMQSIVKRMKNTIINDHRNNITVAM